MANDKPILVKIVDIVYSAKSSNKCYVLYKNKVYTTKLPKGKKITFSKISNIKIGSLDKVNFYYDSENDEVFSKNIGDQAFNVMIILFIISLFLWLIPKEKFKF